MSAPRPGAALHGWLLAGVLSLLAAASAARATQPGEVQVTVRNGQGAALAHAAVYLESPAARASASVAPDGRIVQRGRRFMPPVTVVRTGTAVHFPNEDTVRHHVYSFSEARTFELKLYIGTPAQPVVFDRAGTAVLGCNIHDQMIAWVHVVDTPHHAVTDEQGHARLVGVPPGEYSLRAWHPGLPEGTAPTQQPLSVSAHGLVAVELRLPAQGLPTP